MKNLLLILMVITLGTAAQAQTYTESVLYNFPPSSAGSGVLPGALVRDSAGNLYGTTMQGGSSGVNCNGGGGCGTIFKISTSGVFTTLYKFSGASDGMGPCCLVIDKSGNLYGTTTLGGLGYGVVFKFSATKKFSTLHQFGRLTTDGLTPTGPLTMDTSGNLYGMTLSGGTNQTCGSTGVAGCGTIFEITAKGKESILYSFASASGPPVAFGSLLRDGKGNLYGLSGNGDTLFELSSSGVESTVASGLNQGQGGNINAGYIARNTAGNYFGGFTYWGNCGLDDCNAWSGLWEVNGSSKTVTYYYFTSDCDPVDYCSNGIDLFGPLFFSGGDLYGATNIGGTGNWGAVYKFDSSTSVETILYDFGTDGTLPTSGVITDPSGNLYGTTYSGGTYGTGTVFKLTENN